MTESATGPTQHRHDAIDALRGFALTGVCLVNLLSLSLYDFLDEDAKRALPSAAFDAVAVTVVDWLVSIKFITLFSLLFGLGFSLQLQRASARGEDGLARYVRRLLVLMAVGAAHAWWLWWGDVLFLYALVGLLMLPLRNLSDRSLLVLGVAVTLLPPLISPYMKPLIAQFPSQPEMYSRALVAFSSPRAGVALDGNIALSTWMRVTNWGLICFVLGRFLLGYWAGRKGLLAAPEQHRELLRKIFIGTLLIGVAATALGSLQAPLRAAWPLLEAGAARTLVRMLVRIGPLALGIAYAAGFALLFCRPAWARRLRVLAPLGRTALSNYLAQTLIGIGVFYGVGAGVGPNHGVAAVLIAAVAVLCLQLWWSHAWLARFHYGPMEWLWRWATYGRRPRLRRRAPAATGAVSG